MKNKNSLFIIVSAFLLLSSQAMPVQALEFSNEEILASARAVAAGTATEKQKAIAFAENDKINNLAMSGKLDNSEYQANQRAFVAKNDELIRQAANKRGLSVLPPVTKVGDFKPGTDTDRQLASNKGPLKVDDVKNMRNDYNQQVGSYLKSAGLKPAAHENWAKKLTTDIMPSPDMPAGEFKAATTWINSQGGVAYNSAEAAKLQLAIDGNAPQNLSSYEAAAYHNEMQKKIQLMNNEVQRLRRERRQTSNPELVENIDIEIRKHTAFMSKYIERDNHVADLVLTPDDQQTRQREKETRLLKDAQRRNAAKEALRAEASVEAMNGHLATKATGRMNEAIYGAALAGGDVAAADRAVAANLKNLTAPQQSQALADLEARFGAKAAKAINAELKKTNAAAIPTAVSKTQTLCGALGLVNTALNIRNQYEAGKSATEILWNMSIGGTLENVSNETADYTRREIERLQAEYRAAGEDPDSIATRLKIMAQASVKGTFHGSLIGSYDLLKTASKGVAGAAATAGESALFLVGEALDTHNVLEQSYAEIQAQNMEQSVQSARAIKFGKDAVAELKRLAAEAAYFKSVLEQNARSAKLALRQLDHQYESLAAFVRNLDEASDSNEPLDLTKVDMRLEKQLNGCSAAIKTLLQKAEIASYDLQAGKSKTSAANIAAGLLTAAAQQKAVLDRTGSDFENLDEIARARGNEELLAEFETRRQQLLEAGRQAAANAEIMRKNEAQYKKNLTAFDTLKDRIEKAGRFFGDSRQTYEGDWLVVKSRLGEIARPDGRMPENFFGEVGTLERVPDSLKRDLLRLKLPAVADMAESSALAASVLNRRKPQYESALAAYNQLLAAIKKLQAQPVAAKKTTTPPAKPPAKTPEKAPVVNTARPQPAQKLLPCGHRPGECPKPLSLKCSLHSGKISER